MRSDLDRFGDAALHGWRKEVADRVAPRAPLADGVVRAALGAFWFAASTWYVIQSVRALRRELRR